MEKIKLEKNLLSPLPIVLVGVLVKKRPNFLVIGYISPFNFGKHVFFSLYKKRYTSIGIHENQTFSVNIPSIDLLKKQIFVVLNQEGTLTKALYLMFFMEN